MDQRDADPDADTAEAAFAALRDEVAALRHALERWVAGAGQATRGAPDYSPTLGAIAQEMQAIGARLDTIERTPALAVSADMQAADIRKHVFHAGQEARQGLMQSQARLDETTRALQAAISTVRQRQEQREWLWAAGLGGVMAGLVLYLVLVAVLPWGADNWLAALPLGGGPWQAGEALMQRAQPASWERMVRLYQACPKGSPTELCEAELAARSSGQRPRAGEPVAKPQHDAAPRNIIH